MDPLLSFFLSLNPLEASKLQVGEVVRGKALSGPPLFDQLRPPYLGYLIFSRAIFTPYLAFKNGFSGVRSECALYSLIERLWCFSRGGGGWGCLSDAGEKVESIMGEVLGTAAS